MFTLVGVVIVLIVRAAKNTAPPAESARTAHEPNLAS